MKTELIRFRVTKEQRQLFERAAGVAGLSLSAYIVSTLLATVQKLGAKHG